MLALRLQYVLPLAVMACATDEAPDAGSASTVVLTSKRIITLAGSAIASSAMISGTSETLVGIDVRPADGKIIALSSAGKLYTIDPATGVAASKSTLAADTADTSAPYTALAGTRFGLDFNPVVDRLRVVSNTGQNLRINVDSGATFTDTPISGAVTGYGQTAYTNSFAAACRTTLYGIDEATDQLVLQNPPNDGTTTAVGALGVDATSVVGFDVQSDGAGTVTASALLTVAGALELRPIDLATGRAGTGVAISLDSGETAIDFAVQLPAAVTVPAQAPGELYALTETGKLLSINRGAPGKPCTTATIGGLGTGESVVGIDFRPSTGQLYALTNAAGAGKLYTIDPATGAATSALAAALALTGTEFGMDFNPTGPVALRIVSNAGQNLRIDLVGGTVNPETQLNGGNNAATAAAYTNSVPGATATQLYVLDTELDRLRIQAPPAMGTLDAGVALGIDLDDTSSFDIDGRDNLGFVVANVAGSTTSTLRTVNIMTGVMSASLGTLGGERIRGIARVPPAAAP